ncbi:hypothetical protein [Nannocystis pusilla]|uniref:hypothetical protein n=1 Tax=Nannocystis pusilla TaxID=889268 RepID=UPI003B7CB2CB
MPRPAPTAAFGITLAGPRWEAELSGHYWALRRVDFGDGRGGKFAHGHAAVRGCGAWERGRVRVPLCGGLALGGVSGEGVGALIPALLALCGSACSSAPACGSPSTPASACSCAPRPSSACAGPAFCSNPSPAWCSGPRLWASPPSSASRFACADHVRLAPVVDI